MHWLIAIIINLALVALPSGEPTKSPQAWEVDPEGTKWAILQGRSDVPGEAFTYAAFIPEGSKIFIRAAAMRASPWYREC